MTFIQIYLLIGFTLSCFAYYISIQHGNETKDTPTVILFAAFVLIAFAYPIFIVLAYRDLYK